MLQIIITNIKNLEHPRRKIQMLSRIKLRIVGRINKIYKDKVMDINLKTLKY